MAAADDGGRRNDRKGEMAKQLEAEAGTEPSDQAAAILADIAERSRKLIKDFLARQQDLDGPTLGFNGGSPTGGTFVEMLTRLMSQPQELMQAQFGLWQDHARLWQVATQACSGWRCRRSSSPNVATAGSRTRPGTRTRCSTSSSSPTC